MNGRTKVGICSSSIIESTSTLTEPLAYFEVIQSSVNFMRRMHDSKNGDVSFP